MNGHQPFKGPSLHIDSPTGVAGVMLLSALLDLGVPAEVIEADLILLALGFLRPRGAGLKESLGLEFDQAGRIQRGKDFQTSLPGVYVAGDASRGASLIVWAISDGREAAREIDLALMGESTLPTRGEDSLFYR